MKIGIIGLGLMGGSFGRTLVKQGEHTVYGADLSEAVMLKGEMMKAYHKPLTKDNVNELDVLIVSVYAEAFKKAVNPYMGGLKKGAIVIDFCGIKRPVIGEMRQMVQKYPHLTFIGGHPMAGREFSGIERSTTTLFDKASMILVNVNADIFTLDSVKKFFLNTGFSQVVLTTEENHDKMIAYTSQLCHLVSNAFIKNKSAEEHNGYSAGSYKDLTRVARLEPSMWTDLIISNKDNVVLELDELIENLQKYRSAINNNDSESLRKLLEEGSSRKIAIDSRNNKNV